MKKIDKTFKQLFIFLSIIAVISLGILSISADEANSQNNTVDKTAFRNNQQLESLLNDATFELYCSDQMKLNSFLYYTDVFKIEFKEENGNMIQGVDRSNYKNRMNEYILNNVVEQLGDIRGLQALYINNDTNQKTYLERSSNLPMTTLEANEKNYRFWYRVNFDENGNQTVQKLDDGVNIYIDPFITVFNEASKWFLQEEDVTGEYATYNGIEIDYQIPKLTNCTVIFGIPDSLDMNDNIMNYIDYTIASQQSIYYLGEVNILYTIIAMALLGLIYPLKKIRESFAGRWLDNACWELRALIVFTGIMIINIPLSLYNNLSYSVTESMATEASMLNYILALILAFVAAIVMGYGVIVSVYWIKTIFTDGLQENLKKIKTKEIVKGVYRTLKQWFYDCLTIQLSKESYIKLIGILAANVFILCSIFWIFNDEFLGALIYSIALFVLILKIFKEIQKNYTQLLTCTRRLSQGDLETDITEELGVFDPIKNELEDIRIGFKIAIDEETKSQKMKTELISNVSHDLKTPLTSLISYVDLLKKETDEEKKKDYLETVERSSLRLKHLIEDLFEVSKANSGDIRLDIVDVDIVSLINQTLFELAPQIEKSGLTFKTDFEKEKMIMRLDAHKTYRIIENLFNNAIKYSIPNTRVYVKVTEDERTMEFSVRNISSEEITFDPNDLVERFVRGDKSRNSEGSGLGLAISKGFTEAQDGKLSIETDGDYFKVTVKFKK